ncbi:mRNA turnover protein 4 homolog [Ornithodoros turicata]|uniref:mRNA turnover protein 4 homolog n=1 Tax=Ornithodoros turicata TaxID=34597 RepID=UPI00313A1767
MPRSKRSRQVSLTQTKKRGIEQKEKLIKEVRDAFDQYDKVFVYSVKNMRNSKLKDVRQEWKDSRFYFGKNKVLAVALGRCIDEDHRPNLHHVSERLRGQCGLLFTNRVKEDVLNWFQEYRDSDYAHAGSPAAWRVFLDKGPLTQFVHSMEPHLRQLGLPTTLQRGVVTLSKEHVICEEGDILRPEQASLLKLLGIKMAEFRVFLEFMWNADGTYTSLEEPQESKRGTKRSILCDEEMEPNRKATRRNKQ